MHGTIHGVYQIEGSNQAIEMWSGIKRELATAAAMSPVVELSASARLEEAILLRSLAVPHSVKSLKPSDEVRDVLVIFCGESSVKQFVRAGSSLHDEDAEVSQIH